MSRDTYAGYEKIREKLELNSKSKFIRTGNKSCSFNLEQTYMNECSASHG